MCVAGGIRTVGCGGGAQQLWPEALRGARVPLSFLDFGEACGVLWLSLQGGVRSRLCCSVPGPSLPRLPIGSHFLQLNQGYHGPERD